MAVSASLPQPRRSFASPAPERGAEGWPGLASGVLDMLSEAVLVIARDFRLLGTNRAGRLLLREGDGLAASACGVTASSPAATSELRRAVERAARGERRHLEVPRPGRGPLSLLLEPHPLAPSGLAAAVLFVTDPERGRKSRAERLAARWGFTPAECDVAQRLAAGEDLDRISAELGITLHTVRGHLKHVYAKAGVHRQAELVAKLLSETWAPATSCAAG
jgi:DNA-binding CsgD family transcriptional regulator